MEKPHADCPDDCTAPGNGPQAHVNNPNCIWRDTVVDKSAFPSSNDFQMDTKITLGGQ